MKKKQAFLQFCNQILSGEEGYFWSEQMWDGYDDWRCGYGDKEVVNFDEVEECVVVTDFLGKERYCWQFSCELRNKKEEGRDAVKLSPPFSKGEYRGISCIQKNPSSVLPLQKGESKILSNENKKLKILIPQPRDQDDIKTSESRASFITKINTIKDLACSGELWVLNFSYKIFVQNLELIQLLHAFYNLLKSGKNHAGGIIWTKELKLVSFSPEVFVRQEENYLSTFPVKGTGTKDYLETSEKEISELSMVTDLLRNDLGQIAERVEVLNQRKITKQSNSYQAHAEIRAVLQSFGDGNKEKGKGNKGKRSHFLFDQYLRLLPAGSITGAPKRRVTDYVLELENEPRGFYTGTFGVKKSRDSFVANILIRTFFFEDDQWEFPVGVGVTHMSDPEAEWEECQAKFSGVMEYFGFN